MRLITLVLFKLSLLTACLPLLGQSVYFNNTFNNPLSLSGSGNSVFIDTDKYMVCGNGNYYDFSCFTSTIDLLAIDMMGNLDTFKTYNYSNMYWQTSEFISTPDSGYLIYTSSMPCMTPASNKVSLLRLDNNGDSLWSGSINLANGASDVKITADSGALLTGSSFYYDGVNPTISDFVLVRLDATGNVLWNNSYGDNVFLESATSVQITADNEYMVFGTVKDSINSFSDIYILKTDSAGNQIWQKRISSTEDVIIYGSIESNDGMYIVYGLSKSPVTNNRQAYIAKIDTSGTVAWEKTYGDADFESIYAADLLNNGGLICAGASWIDPNKSKGLLMKLNANGDSIWAMDYSISDSTSDRFNDVKETADGGFICTGTSSAYVWLVSTDSLGCVIADCAVGVSETKNLEDDISVYPIPFHDVLNIDIEADNPGVLMVSIINILGQVEQSYSNLQVVQGKNVISLNTFDQNLPAGIYFISISLDGVQYHFPAIRY